MSGWRTLEGVPIADIYDAICAENKKVTDENGMLIAYVGCDGQNIGRDYTSFVQCVALHNIKDTGRGAGGRVFFIRHLEKRYFERNRRLLREAEIAINLTQKLQPLLDELGIVFEVHADVNSNPAYESNSVHDAIAGWIQSMGWECKTKPDAFVASIVADRHTRGCRFRKKKKPILLKS